MRYFVNRMQDFVAGSAGQIDMDKTYWRHVVLATVQAVIDGMPPRPEHCPGGLYVGCAGVAYMFQYLANCEILADERNAFLAKAEEYSNVALNYAMSKRNQDPPAAFLLGTGGAYVVGGIVTNDLGQKDVSMQFCKKYQSLSSVCQPIDFLSSGSDELLVGRAGYLCGALHLNKYLGEVVDQHILHSICHSVISSGRQYAKKHKSESPLMYAYYGTEYLGAAHGLSGILQMLLCFPDFVKSDVAIEQDVKTSVDFMLSLMQPNGNISPAMDEARGRRARPAEEELVHWCHGAPGVVYLFAKAYLLWKDNKYMEACIRCAQLTWEKGLLRKGPGICHGVAGSGYVFLLLFRLTRQEKYLYRALKFAEFMQTTEFQQGAKKPDSPYSLYEGLAGTALFLVDMLQPDKAEFPFFDVFK